MNWCSPKRKKKDKKTKEKKTLIQDSTNIAIVQKKEVVYYEVESLDRFGCYHASASSLCQNVPTSATDTSECRARDTPSHVIRGL